MNSISRIRFHELICEFGNIQKSSYKFARLRFGSFLRNQCYVANGLYCICLKISQFGHGLFFLLFLKSVGEGRWTSNFLALFLLPFCEEV